jgi:hypothetical protein
MQLFTLWKHGLKVPLSKNVDEEYRLRLRQMGDEAMELNFVPFSTQLFLKTVAMTALDLKTASNGELADTGHPEEQGLLAKRREKTSPTRVCQQLYSSIFISDCMHTVPYYEANENLHFVAMKKPSANTYKSGRSRWFLHSRLLFSDGHAEVDLDSLDIGVTVWEKKC